MVSVKLELYDADDIGTDDFLGYTQVDLPATNAYNFMKKFGSICHQVVRYSKTPIYRSSWGKGIGPGKSRGTVNRGTFYIDLHIKLVFGGEN